MTFPECVDCDLPIFCRCGRISRRERIATAIVGHVVGEVAARNMTCPVPKDNPKLLPAILGWADALVAELDK